MTNDSGTPHAGNWLEVLDGMFQKLRTYYIFPDVSEEVEQTLRQSIHNGDYADIHAPVTFAAEITEHMQRISHDKHLRLFYQPVDEETAASAEKLRVDAVEKYRARARCNNYGFFAIQRRPGNVGYLDLHNFFAPDIAGESAANAMSLLSNTDALIVDIRKNGGGSPAMVTLMCSYFLRAEPIHLNSIHCRYEDSVHQFWSLPYVPGKRYLDRPVYILTSRNTFSAAEEFVYNLKSLARAVVIGEVTCGGAHPGDRYRLSPEFELFVPTCRSINPITQTNWEGVGVQPDILTTYADALKTAERLALQAILEKYKDVPAQQEIYQEAEEALQCFV